MKALAVLLLAVLQTACIAEGGNETSIGNSSVNSTNGSSISDFGSDTDSPSGNNSVIVSAEINVTAVDDETANYALRGKVDLHCFTCKSIYDSKCGDPFDPNGATIQIYPGKSVCYKFTKEERDSTYVERGGMSDAEYLEKYQSGALDVFPIRSRCSKMLCNSAPAPAGLSLLLLPLPALISAVAMKCG